MNGFLNGYNKGKQFYKLNPSKTNIKLNAKTEMHSLDTEQVNTLDI